MAYALHSDSIELTEKFDLPVLTVVNGMDEVHALIARGWKISTNRHYVAGGDDKPLQNKSIHYFAHTINFTPEPLREGETPKETLTLRHCDFPGLEMTHLRGAGRGGDDLSKMRSLFLKDLTDIQKQTSCRIDRPSRPPFSYLP